MVVSLRTRILLTVAPLLVLLAIVGGVGAWLLYDLGGRIGVILRENYESVIAMEDLNEALERIDSSFQFALSGQETKAREQYEKNCPRYQQALEKEQHNITLPGEQALVTQLENLTKSYQKQGHDFFALPKDDHRRTEQYYGKDGLWFTFNDIKTVSGEILSINQQNMVEANKSARRTAANSLLGFGLGLAATAVLAGLLVWNTTRAILRPIQAVTHSALAIGGGDLDQVVPVVFRDELGQLAEAFNLMARQLRAYRQMTYTKLLRAQRTSQATIDSFPEPVLVVAPGRTVEMANPAARRLLGVVPQSESEKTGSPWQPPEALRNSLDKALSQQEPSLPEGLDQAFVLPIGNEERFFLPRILPINDPYNNTLGAAVLLMDVTRFRLLDQVKSNLVATVSHELKTPLTSLQLAVHLLLEEAVGPLTPKQTELLLDARENSDRLLTMINNLLDLTRLEEGRGNFQLTPEPPRSLLETAVDAIGPRAADRGITVTLEAPDDLPLVMVDVPRMGHALANLLDNALTYTDRGGQIILRAEKTDQGVVLSVIDTGHGIPPEYLPRVFQRFFRVPEHSQGKGSGLGLAIVREIVLAHGGSVSCESQPGAGSTFRLTLPVIGEQGQ